MTLEDLFIGSVEALARAMGLQCLESVSPNTVREVSVTGEDLVAVLVNLLNEILFLFHTEGALLTRVLGQRLTHYTDSHEISMTLSGEMYDPGRHGVLKEVKAATFHQAQVVQNDLGVSTRVVFDL